MNTPIERDQARAKAHGVVRSTKPQSHLLADLDVRTNEIARYEADLAAGDFTDGDEGQLRGGIRFERHHVEMIVGELEQRYVHDDAIIAVVPTRYRSAMLTHVRSLLVRQSVGGAM